MIARFFVNRPIFAWVIAIVIMLAGLLALRSLPVAQYPDVAPPSVRISATYTGASAETIENSVVQIIEQQLTGLDGLLYFSSSSNSSGSASITVTFTQGTDPDTAQQQVQNKISQITSRLPESVQKQGVTVRKSQTDFLLMAAFYDETDHDRAADVADYLVSNLQDPISRLDGVGSVQVFGSQYAMRVWLNPHKLRAYNLMPSDIESAIKAQNVQVSAGKIGALPSTDTQELNATVTAKSMLQTVEQFQQIIVKSGRDGGQVLLQDVATLELGNESYNQLTRLNGHPAAGIAIMLASGANALATAEGVHTYLDSVQNQLPAGYHIAYPRDTSEFVKISISEVYWTLLEAIILVIIVMFIFLQNWRTTIIPAIAVPVVLLGTFAILYLLNFSVNTLTMFALVLSIGLLVDDAIVVVENVERLMQEKQLSPKQATIESMQEITGALIGIATVLSVVFIPMAFFSGSTGVIYKQFSVTIVSSMLLSVLVAITLTPALCSTFLKPHDKTRSPTRVAYWFNHTFSRLTNGYSRQVAYLLKKPVMGAAVYLVIAALMVGLFARLPSSFLPAEDQGNIMVQYTLPTGASINRTLDVAKQVEHYFLTQEQANLNAIFSIAGYTFNSSGQNSGMAFISLKNWQQRPGIANSAASIAARATRELAVIKDAKVITMNPPAIQGLGQAGGFYFQLKAAPGMDRETLMEQRDRLISLAKNTPSLTAVRFDGTDNAAQLKVDIDQAKALALGVSLTDIDNTLSTAWGSSYVNDFVDRGRVKKVYTQGATEFRAKPDDLYDWHVKNSAGTMTPFSAFAAVNWSYGPELLTRYNGFASFLIQGSAASGISSGDAMTQMEVLTRQLDNNKTNFEWSSLSYQEKLASGQSFSLYAISILVVFLCLAALYESWSIPLSVLLVIPLGVVGALIATSLRGLNNDIYFQVALLTTIGLASKNAILIIEFAEVAYERGQDAIASAVEGARLRLRPILMTSFAFIAGVMPLALSSGAGANSRISIGTGIVGGTLTATFLAIYLVPLFFILVRRLFPKRRDILQ